MPVGTRQDYIMNKFCFQCKCIYCVNKIVFRTLDAGEKDQEVLEAFTSSNVMMRSTLKTTPDEMMKQLKKNFDLIAKHCVNPTSVDVELLEYCNRYIIRDLAQTLTYPCARLKSECRRILKKPLKH
jgi:hypothetical protein